MEKPSDEYLMTVINKLDGIGEVPWLIQKEMARELLELRKQCLSWQQAFERGCDDMGVLNKRLAAAEKVVELFRYARHNPIDFGSRCSEDYGKAELEAYDRVKND